MSKSHKATVFRIPYALIIITVVAMGGGRLSPYLFFEFLFFHLMNFVLISTSGVFNHARRRKLYGGTWACTSNNFIVQQFSQKVADCCYLANVQLFLKSASETPECQTTIFKWGGC